jgi:hypothetical protein
VKGRLILLAACITLAGCGTSTPAAAPSPKPALHTLHGTLLLEKADGSAWEGIPRPLAADCIGLGFYSDLQAGAPVTVKNEAGAIVGIGSLSDGAWAKGGGGTTDQVVGCTFSFSVPNLPAANFYTVEVSHRGGLTYSRAELESNGWWVASHIDA